MFLCVVLSKQSIFVMKFIVTGSTGNISKPLSSQLVRAGHDVSIVSSNPEKTEEILALGAQALIGSVEDASFLTKAFAGADGVYTMIPPNMVVPSWKDFIYRVGDSYVTAIRAAGVKKVVNLSSIGAHMAQGGGLLSLYYHVEQNLNKIPGIHVVHLRPGSFYTNFLGNIGMIKHLGVIGNNYADRVLPLAHPDDIAAVAFAELSARNFSNNNVRYVVSDERRTDDIAKVLGTAIGKPDLKWVGFKDEDVLNGMLQAGLSRDVAENLVKMGQAVASGEAGADYLQHKPAPGSVKLEDFAKQFALAYANS